MKKNISLLLTAFLLWLPLCLKAQSSISPTRYNYTNVAKQIAVGCTNDYERARAIYRWMCKEIAYDVSRRIHTADSCWEQRRGVCQAYCELFYRLAEPLGISVQIISGTSKERDGSINGAGHSWLFVVTDKAENSGILVDPTWGAGYVDGDVFIRKADDMSWFDIRPEWLIFTHLPEESKFQFLPHVLSPSDFAQLPFLQPSLAEYGLDGATLLNEALQGKLELPTFYDSHSERLIQLKQIPLLSALRVGTTYDFVITKKVPCKIALFNNKEVVEDEAWEQHGNTWRLRFTPSGGKDLLLGVYDRAANNYQIALAYDMESATSSDLRLLEQKRPFAMPEVKGLKNFNEVHLKEIGIDGQALLAAVRRGEVSELPEFYDGGTDYTAVEIPLNGTLQRGSPYTFRLKAAAGAKWAIVHQGQWYKEWTTDSIAGTQEICVTPQQSGELMLMVTQEGSNRYHGCLKYIVKE